MGSDMQIVAPEHTAVRVALWRALHVQLDSEPHIFKDEIGALLVAESNWRDRPDMNSEFSKSMRASIVGRARFIEDLVLAQLTLDVKQFVLLGAGLDTFAQRCPEIASRMQIFEVDQAGPQAWKRKRLAETGYGVPEWLHFVPVDFEAGQSWWEKLISSGFDSEKPAVVVSTGVSMYLTKAAKMTLFRQMAKLAPASTFAMTFMLALDLLGREERASVEFVMKKAKESGTPFLSLFPPSEILAMAAESGFNKSHYISAQHLHERYFACRSDGLNAGTAEGFLIALT